MEKQKAEELYINNKDSIEVKFTSYYKYSFSYEGQNENMKIYLSYGGNSDDIYRFDVDTKPIKLPDTLQELEEQFVAVYITDSKTGERYEYYESF